MSLEPNKHPLDGAALPTAIESVHNQRFAAWNTLRTREDRASRGVFLLDGEKLAGEAVANGRAQCLLVSEKRLHALERLIALAQSNEIEIVPLAERLIEKLAQTPSPQGVIAVASLPEPAAPDTLGSRVIALDGVQDAGNVGAIIRTADAAGITGILLTETCADPYSLKAVRASMGSIFRVPALVSDAAAAIAAGMKARGARVLAASMRGTPYRELRVSEPWVLVIGSEGRGISGEFEALATDVVSIPMRGGAESLNASVAAGILMYALTSPTA